MSLLDRSEAFSSKNSIESNRVNVGEEDELVLQGYVPSLFRLISLLVLSVLSGGILLILCSWRPSIKARIAHRRCSLEQAQLLLVRVRHSIVTQQRQPSLFILYFKLKLKFNRTSKDRNFSRKYTLRSVIDLLAIDISATRNSSTFGTMSSRNLRNLSESSPVQPVSPVWHHMYHS